MSKQQDEELFVYIPWSQFEAILADFYEIATILAAAVDAMAEEDRPDVPILALVPKIKKEEGH